VDDLPEGWTATDVKHDFTITLFAFAWALLPVGFMFVMAISTRYAQHRVSLAAAALSMLVLAFATGAGQRRSSLQEPRVQLAIASLVSATLSLGLIWGMDMDGWWWVAYGLIFGSVAAMYVSLNHLASCDASALRIPWSASEPLPLEALENWRVYHGRWTNGRMGLYRFDQGGVCTIYGTVDEGITYLCVEPLTPSASTPQYLDWGVQFSTLAHIASTVLSEE